MKGGQASPMFPTNGKKRGCAFENPEPSSPKVTCIGQVRVKTKKQSKKIRARSKRRGEVSFRKVDQNSRGNNVESCVNQEYNLDSQFHHHQQQQQQQPQECLPHRNQRWVHLPITICEALRAFGAEFNCFLPCRSSCMANQRDKQGKALGSAGNGNGNSSSCGAVFARWLVAVQEGEGKAREIELVVGEEEEERRDSMNSPTERRRRHIFDNIEIDELEIENAQCQDKNEEEEARVSICIPPKNALLLMRCRSDPVKMAALANRFWESPMPPDEDEQGEKEEEEEKQGEEEKEEEEEGEEEEEEENEQKQRDTELRGELQVGVERETEHEDRAEVCERATTSESIEKQEIQQAETSSGLQTEETEDEGESDDQGTSPDIFNASESSAYKNREDGHEAEAEGLYTESVEAKQTESVEESELNVSRPEILDDPENEAVSSLIHETENDLENEVEQEKHIEAEDAIKTSTEEEPEEDSVETQELTVVAAEEKGTSEKEEEEETVTHERSVLEDPEALEPDPGPESKFPGSKEEESARETTQDPLLPDCLLLMMCEPKLSMEVSKETWVCSTDFIRWLPERPPVKKTNVGDETKKRISIASKNLMQPPFTTKPPANKLLLQPPRSSCSFPAAPPSLIATNGGSSMATMIDQKLVGANSYEPFVLTRCKSEPMRSSTKLAPENCFWKNRKLEPHRPTTLGIGAAGVGF